MIYESPVSFGCVGLGGYAGVAVSVLESHQALQSPIAHLVAVCEPDHRLYHDRIGRLRARGIEVYSTYESFLRDNFEAVWLPVPIHLHRTFTETALAAGKAVLCEKPAAGSIQDVDAMIVARDRARLPVAVAFQGIFDPAVLTLKRELLSGRIGRIRRATFLACTPRYDRYYARTWAGRAKCDSAWVMDSPPMNASAHGVTLALYLLGESETSAARPLTVEAELYRTRPVECFDTAALRATFDSGVQLTCYTTHACSSANEPILHIVGENGELIIGSTSDARFVSSEGTTAFTCDLANSEHALVGFSRLLRGLPLLGAVATLEIARQHVVLVNAAAEAAVVHDIPASALRKTYSSDGDTGIAIAGIEHAFIACARSSRLLHEAGIYSWTSRSQQLQLTDYHVFNGPHC